MHQAPDGTIFLKAASARLIGEQIRYGNENGSINYWRSPKNSVEWDVQLDKPGRFSVIVNASCAKGNGGSRFVVGAGNAKATGTVKETGDWTVFKAENIGTLEIPVAGKFVLAVTADSKEGQTVMKLRSIELRPEK